MRPNILRITILAAFPVVLLLTGPAAAGTWQLSSGVTLEQGGVLELAWRSRSWELAAGYLSEQEVLVNYITPTCPYQGAPADSCSTSERKSHEVVDPYGYLSIQRRFGFWRHSRLQPQFGLGLVVQSETNEYVSTPVNFSLSLGLALSQRVSLEWRHFSNAGLDGPNLGQDAVLLRWQFD